MFDLVRNNKKFIQVILALIVLPFALWGVDSYVRTGGADGVASVGGSTIALNEFQQALREQQERLRAQGNGKQPDPELIESVQFRQQVLDELITQRLLSLHAAQAKLRVSDETLAGFITSQPSLQEGGKFSRERYQALVAAQGMTVELFESRVRQDLVLQQALMAAGNAAVAGRLPTDRWLGAQLEERIVSEHVLRAEQFSAEIKVDVAAVKRYYEEHRAKFEEPEQVRAAFVVLSQEKITEKIKVDDAAIKAHYQAREAQYKQPEQRRASHILIRVDEKASDADVAAAKTKADQLLAQLKKIPADFAKLAKQHSQDPGSADKGGDLGYFGRGMMVKPFEDAAFALADNQLSGLVRSDFGFHLIRVTGIRPERVRPLDDVRDEIIVELRQLGAVKQYAEAAEGFGNTVYEQSDSLKPVAEKFGLTVQETSWMSATGKVMPPFSEPKLMKAIFSEDAIRNKRNTDAIDVGGNTLISARVIEHRPAILPSLETVAPVIEKALVREAAVAKAKAMGEEKLGLLKKGEPPGLSWTSSRTVKRMQTSQYSVQVRRAIFGASTQTLPAYAGAEVPGGYALYRIEKANPYAAKGGDAAPVEQFLRQQYGQIIAQEEMAGWLAVLRERFPVTVNKALLERK
jgi:peptidyl-prolyl cis-trans isomerase D